MNNPVLVEVTRGERVESRHRGSLAVCDAHGAALVAVGDIEARVFPRSAIKVFQAIPLVESGAADAYGFGAPELSLACASHSGEDGHVELAAQMLTAAGLGAPSLECGCHWPFDLPVALDLARRGLTPSALHNNCSGKHAGFLCTAVHCREEAAGYAGAGHAVQRRAKAVIEDLVGETLDDAEAGIDGCSIPTYAAPLRAFAQGFARLGTGVGISPERAAAGQRLLAASMAEPWFMSGTGRACLTLMTAAPGRIYAKTGAEGVFCGAIPELGLGFALKIDDGTTRASESAVAALLARVFAASDPSLANAYATMARRGLENWEKTSVGEIRSVGTAF